MDSNSGILAGIDIGGTKMIAALGTSAGDTIDAHSFPTTSDPEADLNRCLGWLNSHDRAPEIASVGVACPGPYDRRDRIMLDPPNMAGWHGFEIGDWFDQRVSKPVRLMNDANAGAYAEWLWGGHTPESTLIFLTMSTGMGAGVIVDGTVIEGTRGFAAEVGRIQLDDEGPAGFGARGTVEGFLSGPGIAQAAAAERLICEQTGEASGLRSAEHLDARVVCDLAAAGDPAASRVVDRVNARLGQLVAVLGNVLEPDVIVLGTIAAAHPRLFLEPAYKAARTGMIPRVHDRMRLTASSLRDRGVKQTLAIAVLAGQEACA